MVNLYLTGWQQKRDALADLVPDAVHFDYAAYTDSSALFAALPKDVELAVGWSLGGQLLVRAVAGGTIKPKKLILLAAPFQCVADEHFPVGMAASDFNSIREQYVSDAAAMLAQFQGLVGFGDRKTIRELSRDMAVWQHGLFWLEELARASCRGVDFSTFPETVIIHGTGDKVIDAAQAKEFAGRIPQAKLMLLPGGNHAPHLQVPERIKEMMPCLTTAV